MGFQSEQIFEGGSPNLRKIKEENEDVEEESKKVETETVRETITDARQFDSLLDNRFSYNPGDNRFSVFDKEFTNNQEEPSPKVVKPSIMNIGIELFFDLC